MLLLRRATKINVICGAFLYANNTKKRIIKVAVNFKKYCTSLIDCAIKKKRKREGKYSTFNPYIQMRAFRALVRKKANKVKFTTFA